MRRRDTGDDDDSLSKEGPGGDPMTSFSRRQSGRRGFSDNDDNGTPSFTTAITAEPSEILSRDEDGSRRDRTRKESGRRSRDTKHVKSRGTASDDDSTTLTRGDNEQRRRKSSRQHKQEETRGHGENEASLPQNQFPGEIPTTYTQPYRPPGLAAEYYGDHGESVAFQPGVRPNPPSIITNAEQAHLMEPTLTAQPPPEPSSVGQVGAAASYFAVDTGSQSTPCNPSKTSNSRTDPPATHSNYGASPRASPRLDSTDMPPLNQRPSRMNSLTGPPTAAQLGEAAEYYAGGSGGASINAYQTPTRPQPALQPGSAPAGLGGSQHQSNAALYGGAALAGAAAGAYMSGHSHHEQSIGQNHPTASFSGGYPASQVSQMQQTHRHKHQGILGRFVDWFRDPDAVAQYEQYTEAIGVCKYCFDPMSSPADAPRKHHYRRRRPSSGSRYGSTTRVDKVYKYSSDEGRRKSSAGKKIVLGGLAGLEAARVGDTILKNRHDFEDTHSVKSGHPVTRSRVSFQDEIQYQTTIRPYPASEDARPHRLDSGRRTVKGSMSSEYPKHRRRRSSTSSSSSSSQRGSHTGALSAGMAATGLAIGASALNRKSRHRSKSRSRSPSPRQAYFSRRVSPMHSYVDLTTTNDGPGGLVGFFTSPSANQKKGKKPKGFFNFANASSSSSDADLRFGEATVRRKVSKKGRNGKHPRRQHDDSTAAIMGLVERGNALAAEADGVSGQAHRRYGANGYPGRSGHFHRESDISAGGRDDEWYDTDGDESSSVDTALAYGGGLSALQGRESLLQDRKASKPPYEHSSFGRLNGRGKRSSNDGKSPSFPMAPAMAAAGGWTVSNALLHDPKSPTPLGQVAPMQELEPRPISDPRFYDSPDRQYSRRDPTLLDSSKGPRIASSDVPLKQPQPVVPVVPFIYENISQPAEPDRKTGRKLPRDANDSMRPRRDSSPAKLQSLDQQNNVSFDLSKGRVETKAEPKVTVTRKDRQNADRPSRVDTAPPRRRSSEAGQSSFDSDARMAEIEQELKRLYEEQRLAEELVRLPKPFGITGAAVGSPATAIRDSKDGTYDTPSLKSSLKKTGETSTAPQSASQQERIARMAAQRVRSTPSPVQHDDYGAFFVPAEIKVHLQEHNDKAEHREDIGATVVEIVPGASTMGRREPFDPFTYRPFGLDDKDDPTLHPWPVPMLELIEPTPPGSKAHSVQGDVSPLVEPNAAGPVDDIGEPLERKVSTGSKVTWGDQDTYVYEVQTPEYDRADYLSQSELQRDKGSGETVEGHTASPETSPRPSVSRAWTLDETEAEKLEHEFPVVDDRPQISRAWTIDDKEADEIEHVSAPGNIKINPDPERKPSASSTATEPITSSSVDGDKQRAVSESSFAQASDVVDQYQTEDPQLPDSTARTGEVVGDVSDTKAFAPSPEVRVSKSERRRSERSNSAAETEQPPSDARVRSNYAASTDIITPVQGNDSIFNYLVDSKGESASPHIVEPTAVPTVEGDKKMDGSDQISKPGRSSTFGAGMAQQPLSDPKQDYQSDPEDWERSSSRKKSKKSKSGTKNRKSSKRSSAANDGELELLQRSRTEELPDETPKSKPPGSWDESGEIESSSDGRSRDSKEYRNQSRDLEDDQEADAGKSTGNEDTPDFFSHALSSHKSDASSASKKSTKSIKSESKRDQESSSDLKMASKSESVDDGFVSAEETPEAPLENVDNGESFLESRPEMPRPTDMDMPMGIDGVSGPTDTQLLNEDDRADGLRREIDHISEVFQQEPEPATPHFADSRRLSAIRTSDVPPSPIITSSPTAVPLNFRRPPVSPTNPRFSMSSPVASLSSPITTPRTRQGRPKSTEFRSSKEFRPLYLVEKQNFAKVPPSEATEEYPSLPSSKTSSAHPSMEDLRAEAFAQDQADQGTPSRINAEMFRERGRRHSYSHWHDDEQRRQSPDYLDSRSATPVPGEVQRAREQEKKPKPKYEFHSPSELLQDPSVLGEMPPTDPDATPASPLPSVMSTDVDQDYMSARSRSWSPSRPRSRSRGRKSASTSRSASAVWQDALSTAVGALSGSAGGESPHGATPPSTEAIDELQTPIRLHFDESDTGSQNIRSRGFEDDHNVPSLPPSSVPHASSQPSIGEALQQPSVEKFVPGGVQSSTNDLDLFNKSVPEATTIPELNEIGQKMLQNDVSPSTTEDHLLNVTQKPTPEPTEANIDDSKPPSSPLEQAFQAALDARGLTEGASVDAAYQAFQPELADLGGTTLATITEEADVLTPTIERELEIPGESEQTLSRKASKKDKRRAKKASKRSSGSELPPDDEHETVTTEQQQEATVQASPLFNSKDIESEVQGPPNPSGGDVVVRPGDSDSPAGKLEPRFVEPTETAQTAENEWSFGAGKGKKDKKDKKKKRQTLNLEGSEPTIVDSTGSKGLDDSERVLPEPSTALPGHKSPEVWEMPMKSSKKMSKKRGSTFSEGDSNIHQEELLVETAAGLQETQPSVSEHVSTAESPTLAEQIVNEPSATEEPREPSRPVENEAGEEGSTSAPSITRVAQPSAEEIEAKKPQGAGEVISPEVNADQMPQDTVMEDYPTISHNVKLGEAGQLTKDQRDNVTMGSSDDGIIPRGGGEGDGQLPAPSVASDSLQNDDHLKQGERALKNIQVVEVNQHQGPDLPSQAPTLTEEERREEFGDILRSSEASNAQTSNLASEKFSIEQDESIFPMQTKKSKKEKRRKRTSELEDIDASANTQENQINSDKLEDRGLPTPPDEDDAAAVTAVTAVTAATEAVETNPQDVDVFEFTRKSKKSKKEKKKRRTLTDDFGEKSEDIVMDQQTELPVTEHDKSILHDVVSREPQDVVIADTAGRDISEPANLPDTADDLAKSSLTSLEEQEPGDEPPQVETSVTETPGVETPVSEANLTLPGSFETAAAENPDFKPGISKKDKKKRQSTFKDGDFEMQDPRPGIQQDTERTNQAMKPTIANLDNDPAVPKVEDSAVEDAPMGAPEEEWLFGSKKSKKNKNKRQSTLNYSSIDLDLHESDARKESTQLPELSDARNAESAAEFVQESKEDEDTWGFTPKKKKDKKKNRKSKLEESSTTTEQQTDSRDSEVDKGHERGIHVGTNNVATGVDLSEHQTLPDPAQHDLSLSIEQTADPVQRELSREIATFSGVEPVSESPRDEKNTQQEATQDAPISVIEDGAVLTGDTKPSVEVEADEFQATSRADDAAREDAQNPDTSTRKQKNTKKKGQRQAALDDFEDAGAIEDFVKDTDKAPDSLVEEDLISTPKPKSKKDKKKKRQSTFDDGPSVSAGTDLIDQEPTVRQILAVSDRIDTEELASEQSISQQEPHAKPEEVTSTQELSATADSVELEGPLSSQTRELGEALMSRWEQEDNPNRNVIVPEIPSLTEHVAVVAPEEIASSLHPENTDEPELAEISVEQDGSWSQQSKKGKKGNRSPRHAAFLPEDASTESVDSDIKAAGVEPQTTNISIGVAAEPIPDDEWQWKSKPTKKSKKKKQKLILEEDQSRNEMTGPAKAVEETVAEPDHQREMTSGILEARQTSRPEIPEHEVPTDSAKMQSSPLAGEEMEVNDQPALSGSRDLTQPDVPSFDAEVETDWVPSKKSKKKDKGKKGRDLDASTVEPQAWNVGEMDLTRDGKQLASEPALDDWEIPTKKSKKKSKKNRALTVDDDLRTPGTETAQSTDQFDSTSQMLLDQVASPEPMEDIRAVADVPVVEDYFAPVERHKAEKGTEKSLFSSMAPDERRADVASHIPGAFLSEESPLQEPPKAIASHDVEIQTAPAARIEQPETMLQGGIEHNPQFLPAQDIAVAISAPVLTPAALEQDNGPMEGDMEFKADDDEPTLRRKGKKNKKNKERRLLEYNGTESVDPTAEPFDPTRTRPPDMMTTIPEETMETAPETPLIVEAENRQDEVGNASDVSESTRERRKRRRSPPIWATEEPADLPTNRSLTPPPDHDDIMDTALGVAVGLGFGGREDESTKGTPPERPSPVRQPSAGWSFAKLGPATDPASSEANRDSAVHFDSPLLPANQFSNQRDSGFIATPDVERDGFEGSRESSMDMSLRPPRPQSPTSSTEDVSKTGQHREGSATLETPRRKPSPVESTTKDRSSTLFNSSPAMPTPLNTKMEARRSPELDSSPLRRSPSIHGHHRSREELKQKARAVSDLEHSDQLSSNLIGRSAAAAVNRPSFEAGLSDTRPERRVAARNSLSAIREVSDPHAIPEQIPGHSSGSGPVALVASAGAAGLGAAMLMASTSSSRDSFDAKSLGRSKSRTSSLRNLRGTDTSPNFASGSSSQTPVNDPDPGKSAARERDMADVYVSLDLLGPPSGVLPQS